MLRPIAHPTPFGFGASMPLVMSRLPPMFLTFYMAALGGACKYARNAYPPRTGLPERMSSSWTGDDRRTGSGCLIEGTC